MSDGAELAGWRQRAEQWARTAGACLLDWSRRSAELDTRLKGRRDLVTAADRASEQIVVEGIRATFPEHAILAEEGVASPAGAADRESEWLWMVDPLDGTTNFVYGIPFYCVAISLSHRGELVLGVVHAPALDWTFTGHRGGGTQRNGVPVAVSSTDAVGDALLATGFSYRRNDPGADDNTGRIARAVPVCRDLRRLGSAQLDLSLVAAGTFDGYWEMQLAPHDLGAGGLLVREAGGRVTDLGGGDAWVREGHVLATNGHLHAPLLELVGGTP